MLSVCSSEDWPTMLRELVEALPLDENQPRPPKELVAAVLYRCVELGLKSACPIFESLFGQLTLDT